MSKFIDALQRIAMPPIASIGFQSRSVESKNSQLLVIASVVSDSKKALKTIGTAGADAVLVPSGSQFDFKEVRKAIGDIPAGLSLDGDIESDLPAEADFIVYTIKTTAALLKNLKAGKILEINPVLDMGSIRAINGIGSIVDAVLLGGDDRSITIERLLYCRRLSDLVTQPVLAYVNSSIKGSDIANLCEAGVTGIVITDICTAAKYSEIRKAISELPRNIRRKTAGAAIVPRLSTMPPSGDDEEQEEDE